MGEFSDDDDFADFDLDAAVASAKKFHQPSFCNTNVDDNIIEGGATMKRSPPIDDNNSSTEGNKKFKTAEGEEDDDAALLLINHEEENIPAQFQLDMEKTLQTHFGHGNFRPGQLTVLHSLLMGGNDTCVFWATG